MSYFASNTRLREFDYWPRELQQVSARLSRKGQAQMLDSIEQIFTKLCFEFWAAFTTSSQTLYGFRTMVPSASNESGGDSSPTGSKLVLGAIQKAGLQ